MLLQTADTVIMHQKYLLVLPICKGKAVDTLVITAK